MDTASRQEKFFSRIVRHRFTGFTSYLMIFSVATLILVGVQYASPVNLVVYAQHDTPDFMQVFFLVDGVYSEKNSERSERVNRTTNVLKFTLPRTQISRVRIDPASKAMAVVITKIEQRHLFGTVTYTPNDLLEDSKVIQMIDEFETTPAGLVIHSNGNDPAFELQLTNSQYFLSQLFKLCLMSVFLSFALFWGVRKLKFEKITLLVRSLRRHLLAVPEKIYLLLIPLFVSLTVAALFYPGSMSYDSLHALRSARNGVTDSMFPPMVSYVWRVVDLVSSNPSAMHFTQVFLLLFSIFIILFYFTKKIIYATACLLFFLSIPVVLGTVAVIWKDVLMAAFFLAGFTITLFMRSVDDRWRFCFLSILATFLIFIGVCSRHNAITAGVPLLFYLSLIVCSRVLKHSQYLWIGVVLLVSVLTSTIFISKKLLDNYSLPDLVRINTDQDRFLQVSRFLDVAGASLCADSNLFGSMAPGLSIEEIKNGYNPRHIHLSGELRKKVGLDSRIDKIWLSVLSDHPFCFFYNKIQLTKYLIGANQGAQFIITEPSIIDNEYGYSFPDSLLRDTAFGYIIKASYLPFFRPWFLYLISFGCFIYLMRLRALTAGLSTLFLSAIFYFAGLVMFGSAADARLPFYTTTALSIFNFISIIKFREGHT